MGITPDFLIKHVRPVGMEAYAMICNDQGNQSLYNWLINNGVTAQEITNAFNIWASLALLDVNNPTNLPTYVSAAQAIAEARWTEYYATSASTILFLDAPQIKELSASSEQQPGETFQFSTFEELPLAITIKKDSLEFTADRKVTASVAANLQGDCNHFAGLVT